MNKIILGVIPARYGSTRLEGKPLVTICGKPMIQHVYEQAKKALEHVVVATDDKRIFDAVKAFQGKVVMTSAKHTTGTNRCLEAFENYQKESKIKFNVVINIQGDEPLLAPSMLESLVSCYEDKNTTMATLVTPSINQSDLHSGVFVVINKQNFAMYFSRAIIPFNRDEVVENWNKNHTYYKHIGMYAFTPKALKEFANLAETKLEQIEKLEQLRWLENGNTIKVAITKHHSIPVDTKEDVEKVIQLIRKNQ